MRAIPLILPFALVSAAAAQFEEPISSDVRERLSGLFVETTGGPTPEPGDEIGVFFDDQTIGFFEFASDSLEYVVDVFGDDPETDSVEGPTQGQPIELRFFDVSTNETIDLDALNAQGEVFNLTFQGQEVPQVILDFFGEDSDLADVLIPSRIFSVRAAGTSGGDGDGGNGDGDGDGNGGGGTPAGDPDVNNDGSINERDAALVLRVVVGSTVSSEQRARADVDNDGTVTTRDAIAVLRAAR